MYPLGRSIAVSGLLFIPNFAFTPGTPAAAPLTENISVVDFASNLTYQLSQRPPVRRNTTSSISIRKNLINLVPFELVSVSGAGATISNLNNGVSSGTGFISMRLTVPQGAALGTVITLSVGLTDRFTFRVVNQGAITSITKNPDPSTLQAGTPWVATVAGTDLGSPVVNPTAVPCHTVTAANRSNTSVQFTLQRSATCAQSSYSFRLIGSATNDPPRWATPTGGSSEFGFAYVPPPPSGVTCTSNPNLGTPVITKPTNNQVIVFGAGTPATTNITISWSDVTQPGNVPVPNNAWVVTSQVASLTGGTQKQTKELTGTSIVFPYAIPGTYRVIVRPKNCGQTAPSASVTFSTQYQQ